MNYNETQQKLILREMESGLLALVAVDSETGKYEVIYSDGAYRNYENRYQGDDFFESWLSVGLSLVHPDDRLRMAEEISRPHLEKVFAESSEYVTECRFIAGGGQQNGLIRIVRRKSEPNVYVISIWNTGR